MKLLDTLNLSTRMFRVRLMRTFLTVLGMSVGIGAVLFLVSLGYGLQKTILNRITTSDALLSLDVSEARSDLVPLNKKALDSFRNLPEVQDVIPGTRFVAQGVFGGMLLDISAFVTTPDFLKFGGVRIEHGEGLRDDKPNSLIISSSLASVFSAQRGHSPLGDEILLTLFRSKGSEKGEDDKNVSSDQNSATLEPFGEERSYVIGGIIQGDENTVYIHSASVSDVDIDVFTNAKVRVKTEASLMSVRNSILGEGFLVSALSDTVDQANKIFGVIQIILLSFGIIALVVSAIGMFNTMTISLLERTEEIGIMKSIGASNRDIAFLFVIESAFMGFLGGIGGVAIGYLGGIGLNSAINFLAVRLGGESVSLFYSPSWFIGLIIIFATFVGFITGFFPARRASKIDPLDALRYK